MTDFRTTTHPAIDVSEDIRFVDTDCHIYDEPDLWVKYIDRPFLDRVPHWIEKDGRLLVNMGGNVFRRSRTISVWESFTARTPRWTGVVMTPFSGSGIWTRR